MIFVASVTVLSAATMAHAQEVPAAAPEAPKSTAAPEVPKSAAASDAPTAAQEAPNSAAPKSTAPRRAAPRSGPSRSVGARTAACRLDCSAGNLHGTYRAYGALDPQLKSPESRKLFAECVRLCLDPLPGTYAQKTFIENGGSWFGKTKSDCLGCHAEGKPKRWWPGVNTLPDNLRR
jgi:pyruvate/2-oxoglutarate dehydrogenase complex dihydrolipoamide acyltransferase (E2) component